MPKLAKALSALEVSRLTAAGVYAVGHVAGLQLNVSETGARAWLLRATVGGKRREIGLGAYPGVTLAGALEKARACRVQIASGVDPLAEKKAKVERLREAQRRAKTFKWCAEQYLKTVAGTFRNKKHEAQWSTTLETYAYPKLGELDVASIQTGHVLEALQSIWLEKYETASRVRGRIERVFNWATALGYRSGENPAAWKNNLDATLAKPKAIKAVRPIQHHASMDYQQIGAFMPRLEAMEGMGARALRFLIYCASRSGEVRGMKWGEVDLASGVWTIPKGRMKAGVAHSVPLSDKALELLATVPKLEGCDLVFWNSNGNALSDMTLTAVLRRMELSDITVHGFRSTFRTWAAERTSFPREVAEAALAHKNTDAVEAAYQRSDFAEKRAQLMQMWTDFVHTQPADGATVVELLARRSAA